MSESDVFEQKESVALTVRNDDAIVPEIPDYDPTAPMSLGPVESAPVQLQQADPYYGAGDLNLTDKQRDVLSRPFAPAQLDILPTGEVYAPQVEYRRRLNESFGIGRWSLRPLADPKIAGKTVVRWYALYVNGKFASETFGEADFIENNPRSSWGTALESAKSNALMRCCKDIGVNLECWTKSFTEAWKAQHARRIDGKWQKINDMAAGEVGKGTAAHCSVNLDNAAPIAGSHSAAPQTSAQKSSEPADPPAASSKKILPAKFDGKPWKMKDGTPCMYLLDEEGVKWTIAGQKSLDAANDAIVAGKTLNVVYKLNGKYRNVSSAVIEGPSA